jgi:hypothetical protein
MADYCSLSDLKTALRIADTVDDGQLSNVIAVASGWIDSYCGRQFSPAAGTATRDYSPSGRYEPVMIDDASNVLSVRIDEDLDGTFSTLVLTSDWQAEPVNPTTFGLPLPYTSIRPIEDGFWPMPFRRGQVTVRVEATFGWAEVPAAVTRAAVLQASRLFTRSDSPLGVAGFGEMGVMRVSRFLDPDVENLLNPYRRMVY